jgi:hypothetical protein
MSEQGLPQITNSELIADLEAILLELRDRLNNYLDLGANDLIAADEGFNFAGQLQATLADAVEHTATPGAPGRDPAQRLLSKWGSGRRAKRLVRRRVREVGPKRIPETEEPTQRNGRLLTHLIDPRAYDYEQRLLIGLVENDRRARPLHSEIIFERVEVGRKEAPAELLGRLRGHLDELLAGLYPNGADASLLSRRAYTPRSEGTGRRAERLARTLPTTSRGWR